jgi:protein gp37
MGANSLIEWCDHSYNEWYGCTKVSSACDFCYAEARADKRFHLVSWGNSPRRRASVATRRAPLKWQRDAAKAGIRLRIFANSWSDVFDNQVPSEWRDDFWNMMAQTPNLELDVVDQATAEHP